MKRKAKTALKAKSPARCRRAGKADPIERLVTASAQALALPIDPAWQPGVTRNLQLILRHAALVDAFSLPDDTEPAPVFRA